MKLRDLLQRMKPLPSSLADSAGYLDVCDRASRDPQAFAVFKREPEYRKILEHTTEDQGRAYLQIVRERYPELIERLDRFRLNDRHGDPLTFEFGDAGVFSPTTLRYVKVLGDLRGLFGDLSRLSIVEIGGGYGGQCVTMHADGGFARYRLVDLEPCLRLAQTYLDRCGVSGVDCRTMEQLDPADRYDLVISNYAWSECTRSVQEAYVQRVLSRADRGYLTCNETNPERFASFTRDELPGILPGCRFLPEEPLTADRNFIVVWGDDAGSAAGAER